MKSGLRSGKLVKWKDEQGFGFIKPLDTSADVFLHISEVKDATRRPEVGDTIYYRAVTKNGKIYAVDSFILGARNKNGSNSSKGKFSSRKLFREAFPVWRALGLSFLPLIGAGHFAWKSAKFLPVINFLPLILYIGMGILTFNLYADDKYRAEKKQQRTPERVLHSFELFGGWIGGFIAQQTLRHKSRKQSYQIEFWLIVIIHYFCWVIWLIFNQSILPAH